VKFRRYYITWSGQFEYMGAPRKMKIVVPVTLLLIFLLLYLNSAPHETLIVMLSCLRPGGRGVVMWVLDYTCRSPWRSASSAGRGVARDRRGDADLLDHAGKPRGPVPRSESHPDAPSLRRRDGRRVERVRPKMMTVVASWRLLPSWGTGTGSEVMSRIAAPMVGG